MSISRSWLPIAIWLFASGHAPAADLKFFEAVEPHMGTLVRIQLYAAGQQQASTAFRAAFDRIAQLDAILSDYKSDSELNRISRDAVGSSIQVSEDLFKVLAASQKLAVETGGAFDVTLGPVIRLWRQARKEHRLPAAEAIREAVGRSGYRKLQLDSERRTVQFSQAGMQLDVGGIAKGYAADAALEVLVRLGIHSALVAASGDLVFSDPPPGQAGWRVGIDSLDQVDSAFTRVLELSNAAVSTSGDTRQYLEVDGRRYSHIVDPSTGMGLTVPIAVTVVAQRGIAADSLSTALSVLGPDRGIRFIEKQPGAAALLVTGRGKSARVLESSRWASLSKAPGRTVPGPLRPQAVP